ncbi:MAG: hypothetical protein HC814_06400 [Rhodobacteraceae bacterium]|nr:hypothetical protein [Paracoccaceae bacterium]
MNFEARDVVLIVLGGAFGMLMMVASGLGGATTVLAGIVGSSGAAALCVATRPSRSR